jgi:hypothetical protein
VAAEGFLLERFTKADADGSTAPRSGLVMWRLPLVEMWTKDEAEDFRCRSHWEIGCNFQKGGNYQKWLPGKICTEQQQSPLAASTICKGVL